MFFEFSAKCINLCSRLRFTKFQMNARDGTLKLRQDPRKQHQRNKRIRLTILALSFIREFLLLFCLFEHLSGKVIIPGAADLITLLLFILISSGTCALYGFAYFMENDVIFFFNEFLRVESSDRRESNQMANLWKRLQRLHKLGVLIMGINMLMLTILHLTEPLKPYLTYSILGFDRNIHPIFAILFAFMDAWLLSGSYGVGHALVYVTISYFMVSRERLRILWSEELASHSIPILRKYLLVNRLFNRCFSWFFIPVFITYIAAAWIFSVIIVVKTHATMDFQMYWSSVLTVAGNTLICSLFFLLAASLHNYTSLIITKWRNTVGIIGIGGKKEEKLVLKSLRPFGVQVASFSIMKNRGAISLFQIMGDIAVNILLGTDQM